MAIVGNIESQNFSTGSTHAFVNFTLSSSSARKLVVFVGLDGGDSALINSVTFDPGGGDQESAVFDGFSDTNGSGEQARIETWYIDEANLPGAGDYDIDITYNTGGVEAVVTIYEIKAADTGGPTSVTSNNSNAFIDSTIASTNNSILLSSAVNRSGFLYPSHGSGQIEDVDVSFSGLGVTVTSYPRPVGGNVTLSHTASAAPSLHTMRSIHISGTALVEPEIDDVEGKFDTFFLSGGAGATGTINGVAYESIQGTGIVELGDSSNHGTATLVTQTIVSWSDTGISFTANRGAIAEGTIFVFVTNDSGNTSAGFQFDIFDNQPTRDVFVELFHFTSPGSNGSVVYNLLTQTTKQVKAIYFTGMSAPGIGSIQSDSELCLGIVDSALNQRGVGASRQDGVDNTQRDVDESNALNVLDQSSSTPQAVGNVTNLGVGQFTINWTTTNLSNRPIICIVIVGDDVSSLVTQATVSSGSVAAPFKTELGLPISACGGTGGFDLQASGVFQGPDDTDITQWGWCAYGQSSSNMDSILRTTGCINQIAQGSLTWEMVIDEITKTVVGWSGSNADTVYFLLLHFKGHPTFVSSFSKETSGASDTSQDLPNFEDLDAVDFEPSFYWLASGNKTDQSGGTPDDLNVSMGGYDGIRQYSMMRASEDPSDDSNQITDITRVLGYSDAGSAVYTALGTAQAISDSTPTIIWGAGGDANNTTAYITGVWGLKDAETFVNLAGASTGAAVINGDLVLDIPLAGSTAGATAITGATAIDVGLSSVSTGVATTANSLVIDTTLAATVAGLAVTAADLVLDIVLLGASVGAAATAGAINVDTTLAGTSTGVATAPGNLNLDFSIAGDADGLAVVAGLLVVDTILAGASTGATVVPDAALVFDVTFQGDSDGVSTTSGALNLDVPLVGSATGIGVGQGGVVVAFSIAGTSAGVTATQAFLNIDTTLAGSSDGVAVAVSDLVVDVTLSGISAGVAVADGVLVLDVPLAGTSAGLAVVAGDISLVSTINLAGVSTGAATTQSSLIVDTTLAGVSVGVAVSSGAIVLDIPLAGSSDGLTATTSDLSIELNMSGVVVGLSTVQGLLVLDVPLAGVSTGLTVLFGDLAITGIVNLEGASDGATITQGSLAVDTTLAGVAVGFNVSSGALGIDQILTGSSSGATATSSDLVVDVNLTGASIGLATAQGAIISDVPLAGVSTGLTVLFGELFTIAIVNLAGTSTGATVTQGVMLIDTLLAGASVGASATQAAFNIDTTLAGLSDGLTVASGSIAGISAILEGQSDGSAIVAGALNIDTTLAGFSAGVTITFGLLDDLLVDVPIACFEGVISPIEFEGEICPVLFTADLNECD